MLTSQVRLRSVSIPRRVILRANHQPSTLFSALVYRLDDIDKLLLVLQYPVELVVVAGPKIAHLSKV